MPLFLFILSVSLACSPPSASSGLYVQAGANLALADGSDCYPFASLPAAIAALSPAGGKIIAVPGAVPWPLGGLVIQTTVTLEGQGGYFTLDSSSDIEVNAALVLKNVVLEALAAASFIVRGALSVQGSTLRSLSSNFAKVSGLMEILKSRLTSSLGTLASLSTFGASVKFQDSDFFDFPTAIDFQAAALSASPNVPSSIFIGNCTLTHFQTALKVSVDRTIFSGVYIGVSTLTVDKVIFEDFSEIGLWGNVYFWTVTISNSVFRQGMIGIQMGLNDRDHVITSSEFLNLGHSVNITNLAGSLAVSSCSFTQTNQSIILIKGASSSLLSASHCTFRDIGNSTSTGPVIFAQNAGKVSLLSSQVRNGRGAQGGSVAIFSSAQVDIVDCFLFNLEADQGGVIYIEYTVVKVQRTEVNTAKSKGSVFYVYQQTMTYEDMTVRKAQGSVFLFYCYESAVIWSNNLIENSGSDREFMSLTSSTVPVFVRNTEFRNISFGVCFVQPIASLIYHYENITLSVAPEGMSKTLFYNFGTLLSVTHSTFSGSMQTFVGGVGPAGVTVITDCLLTDLHVVTLFAPGSAVLSVFNSTIRNVEISDPRASRLSTTSVTFVNVTISEIKGQFLTCTQSTLTFTLLSVVNCTVPLDYNFIDVIQSDLTFTATVFDLITLSSTSTLISTNLQSTLTALASSFSRIEIPGSQGIIQVEQSSAQFTKIQARLLTSTFIAATESSLVISQSSFSDIGILSRLEFDGGVVNGLQMLGVSISKCNFTHIYSRNGGAMYITYTNPNKASVIRQMGPQGYVSISQCVFDHCGSSEDGAVAYLNYATATVNESRFTDNIAGDSGGALALYCDPAELQFICFYYINNSDFTNNSALSSGGAIKYDKIKPVLTNVTETNNTAVYGDFLAAFPVELRYMKNGISTPLSTLNGESGSVFSEAIQLGLFDELSQLILSDDFSQSSLVTSNKTALISGLQTVSAQSGVFSFKGQSVTDAPGSLINLELTSNAIDYQNPNPNTKIQSAHLDVNLLLRACYIGEIIQNSVCDKCAAGTYSFNTTDTVCKSCPGGIACHGGANTTVMRDYWRPTNTSELLLNCYAKDICLGGNLAECEVGYGGRLCTFCDEGYFRFGNFFCLPCGNAIWGVFRGILVLLGTAVFLVVMILGNLRNTAKKKSALSIHFRICLNYNQVTMLMSNLQIKWPVDLLTLFEGLKMSGNPGQFAFSNECLTGDSTINYMYQKVLLMALVPFALIALAVLVWGIVGLIKRSTEYLRVHVVCSVIVLLLSMQPMVLQSCLQLFPCVEVEPGSKWLLHDMHIACWEGEHTTYALGVALPAILVWCLATPLGFLVLLYHQRKNLNDPVNVRRIGFLYSGYHPRFYFWEFVVVLRKSVMVVVANIMVTAASHAQSQVAIIILWFFTILQYKETPFETRRFNRTEFLSLLSSLVTVIAGALYLSDLRTQPGAYYTMLTVVFFFNSLFMLTWVLLLIVYLGRGRSHRIAILGKWLDKMTVRYSKVS